PLANRMTPSLFHVPPPMGAGASQTVWDGPPETSPFLSFPSSKKPTERLSGDQNGCEMTLSPISDRATTEPSDTALRPRLGLPALMAIQRPSGDIESGVPSPAFGS